jgi:FdhD protein
MRGFVQTQRVFRETGGTHGAALYDRLGLRLAFAEDIGRHNALDKAVGAAMRTGDLSRARVALVSSRLSFEMVQKAAAAGIEILAGISAATSLGVQLAARQGMTLVGFLRGDRLNVYTHAERLLDVAEPLDRGVAPACEQPDCPQPGSRLAAPKPPR